jgi:hypothetical protein
MAEEAKTSAASYTMVDHLMHGKMENGEEVILFPITRFDNLLGAPQIVTDMDKFAGAPFFFYTTDTVEVTSATIEELTGINTDSDESELTVEEVEK